MNEDPEQAQGEARTRREHRFRERYHNPLWNSLFSYTAAAPAVRQWGDAMRWQHQRNVVVHRTSSPSVGSRICLSGFNHSSFESHQHRGLRKKCASFVRVKRLSHFVSHHRVADVETEARVPTYQRDVRCWFLWVVQDAVARGSSKMEHESG